MKIGIAADHGFALEEHLIAKLKDAGAEYGINSGEGATPLLRELREEGRTRHQQEVAKRPLMERTGWSPLSWLRSFY